MEVNKQLNVRIPVELFDKIKNSGKTQVDITIEALQLYFTEKSYQNASNDLANKQLQSDIDFLRDKVSELTMMLSQQQTLLCQEQALHLQTQKLLPPPQEKKRWITMMQFWK